MTDYTAIITQWFEDVQFKTPDPALVAQFNAGVNNNLYTLQDVQYQITQQPYTQVQVNDVIRIYQAAWSRVPDQGGENYWVNQYASEINSFGLGTAKVWLSQAFASSTEFFNVYNVTANQLATTAVITAMYENVLLRQPDAEGLAYWTAQKLTAAQMLAEFSYSKEYVQNSAPNIVKYQYTEMSGTPITSGGLDQPLLGGAWPITYQQLTTGIDTVNLAGTGGQTVVQGLLNQFPGENSTFNSGDSVTGASYGNNIYTTTVQATLASVVTGVGPSVTLKDIANLNFVGGATPTDVAFNAGTWTDVETVTLSGNNGWTIDATGLTNVDTSLTLAVSPTTVGTVIVEHSKVQGQSVNWSKVVNNDTTTGAPNFMTIGANNINVQLAKSGEAYANIGNHAGSTLHASSVGNVAMGSITETLGDSAYSEIDIGNLIGDHTAQANWDGTAGNVSVGSVTATGGLGASVQVSVLDVVHVTGFGNATAGNISVGPISITTGAGGGHNEIHLADHVTTDTGNATAGIITQTGGISITGGNILVDAHDQATVADAGSATTGGINLGSIGLVASVNQNIDLKVNSNAIAEGVHSASSGPTSVGPIILTSSGIGNIDLSLANSASAATGLATVGSATVGAINITLGTGQLSATIEQEGHVDGSTGSLSVGALTVGNVVATGGSQYLELASLADASGAGVADATSGVISAGTITMTGGLNGDVSLSVESMATAGDHGNAVATNYTVGAISLTASGTGNVDLDLIRSAEAHIGNATVGNWSIGGLTLSAGVGGGIEVSATHEATVTGDGNASVGSFTFAPLSLSAGKDVEVYLESEASVEGNGNATSGVLSVGAISLTSNNGGDVSLSVEHDAEVNGNGAANAGASTVGNVTLATTSVGNVDLDLYNFAYAGTGSASVGNSTVGNINVTLGTGQFEASITESASIQTGSVGVVSTISAGTLTVGNISATGGSQSVYIADEANASNAAGTVDATAGIVSVGSVSLTGGLNGNVSLTVEATAWAGANGNAVASAPQVGAIALAASGTGNIDLNLLEQANAQDGNASVGSWSVGAATFSLGSGDLNVVIAQEAYVSVDGNATTSGLTVAPISVNGGTNLTVAVAEGANIGTDFSPPITGSATGAANSGPLAIGAISLASAHSGDVAVDVGHYALLTATGTSHVGPTGVGAITLSTSGEGDIDFNFVNLAGVYEGAADVGVASIGNISATVGNGEFNANIYDAALVEESGTASAGNFTIGSITATGGAENVDIKYGAVNYEDLPSDPAKSQNTTSGVLTVGAVSLAGGINESGSAGDVTFDASNNATATNAAGDAVSGNSFFSSISLSAISAGNIDVTVSNYANAWDGDATTGSLSIGPVSASLGTGTLDIVISNYASASFEGEASTGSVTVASLTTNGGLTQNIEIENNALAHGGTTADLANASTGALSVGDITMTANSAGGALGLTVENYATAGASGDATTGETAVGDVTLTNYSSGNITSVITNEAYALDGDATTGSLFLGGVGVALGDGGTLVNYIGNFAHADDGESVTSYVSVDSLSTSGGVSQTNVIYNHAVAGGGTSLDAANVSTGTLSVGDISMTGISAGSTLVLTVENYATATGVGDATVGNTTVGNVTVTNYSAGAINVEIKNSAMASSGDASTGTLSVGDVTAVTGSTGSVDVDILNHAMVTTSSPFTATAGGIAVGDVNISGGNVELTIDNFVNEYSTADTGNAVAGDVSVSSITMTAGDTAGTIDLKLKNRAWAGYTVGDASQGSLSVGDVTLNGTSLGNVNADIQNYAYASSGNASAGDLSIGDLSVLGGKDVNIYIDNEAFVNSSGNASLGSLSIGDVQLSSASGHEYFRVYNYVVNYSGNAVAGDLTVQSLDISAANEYAYALVDNYAYAASGNAYLGNVSIGNITLNSGTSTGNLYVYNYAQAFDLGNASVGTLTTGNVVITANSTDTTISGYAYAYSLGDATVGGLTTGNISVDVVAQAAISVDEYANASLGSASVGNLSLGSVTLDATQIDFKAYAHAVAHGLGHTARVGSVTVGAVSFTADANRTDTVSIYAHADATGLGAGGSTGHVSVGNITTTGFHHSNTDIEVFNELSNAAATGANGGVTLGNVNATLSETANPADAQHTFFKLNVETTGGAATTGNIVIGDINLSATGATAAAVNNAVREFAVTAASFAGSVSIGNITVAGGIQAVGSITPMDNLDNLGTWLTTSGTSVTVGNIDYSAYINNAVINVSSFIGAAHIDAGTANNTITDNIGTNSIILHGSGIDTLGFVDTQTNVTTLASANINNVDKITNLATNDFFTLTNANGSTAVIANTAGAIAFDNMGSTSWSLFLAQAATNEGTNKVTYGVINGDTYVAMNNGGAAPATGVVGDIVQLVGVGAGHTLTNVGLELQIV